MSGDSAQISAYAAYRLRWRRRGLLWRSFRSRRQLRPVKNRTAGIRPGAILAFSTIRNEIERMPWFLDHHRKLGVDHFLIVENDSDDGTDRYLAAQADVSLWTTDRSYRDARFGLDWVTWLQMRYAHDHWSLMVDTDEMLIYAQHETRPLQELTRWLEAQGHSVFGALMLDLYPKGPLDSQQYESGDDPISVLPWFDPGPYRVQRQHPLGNLWVQGGARERVFFANNPQRSPTLNKIPLVRWSRRYAYVNSCHSMLPRPLNFGYEGPGADAPSGVLLHTKFLPQSVKRATIEKARGQHFHAPDSFADYYDDVAAGPDMWSPESIRYEGWRQLERLGLMRTAGW
ncbi:glycosyltransferase family 2 protein [Sedimentitalea todarodis]|uniref:Glycosyltransferase family 2 protein n=1 Tax=Sedimentitalea todarodis TaxID=1631240 RepID=A0ABU3VK92_9RHOB|nr:glycosyltransferase family 2 protein [Sedimentitalea todarodis]MDU9006606.1 glycosyltransferase family 2 protein [Sedimentitalea todarodis]